MPRKTSSACAIRATARDFNEAAARCRGKRIQVGGLPRAPLTSMRPRLDAAENSHQQDGIAKLLELQ